MGTDKRRDTVFSLHPALTPCLHPVFFFPPVGGADTTSNATAAPLEKTKRRFPRGLFFFGLYWAYQYYQHQQSLTLPPQFILDLDLETNTVIEKRRPRNPLEEFLGLPPRHYSLSDLVEALNQAGKDPRCLGLTTVLPASGAVGRQGTIHEVREALLHFRRHARARGARALVYTDAFGEGGQNGTMTYYLASAFDRIFTQPFSHHGVVGFAPQATFLRPLFDRWGVEPHFFTRHEYKNMANMFTETKFTEPHRESLAHVVGGLYEDLVQGIATDRHLPVQTVRELIDRSPLSSDEALAAGLVDGLCDRSQFRHLALHTAKENWAMHAEREVQRRRQEVTTAESPKPPPPRPSQAASASEEGPREVEKGARGGGGGEGHTTLLTPRPHEVAATNTENREKKTKPKEEEEEEEKQKQKQGGPLKKQSLVVRVPLHKYIRVMRHRHGVRMKQINMAWGANRMSSEEVQELKATLDKRRYEDGAPRPLLPFLSSLTRAQSINYAPTVVVVRAEGQIVAGPKPPAENPFGDDGTGAGTIHAGELCHTLKTVRLDPRVHVVVVRVDSPGGSALASESIWQEMAALRATGKKIIVSMGNVAASGGYYRAAPADRIIASPVTITGSIGVVFESSTWINSSVAKGSISSTWMVLVPTPQRRVWFVVSRKISTPRSTGRWTKHTGGFSTSSGKDVGSPPTRSRSSRKAESGRGNKLWTWVSSMPSVGTATRLLKRSPCVPPRTESMKNKSTSWNFLGPPSDSSKNSCPRTLNTGNLATMATMLIRPRNSRWRPSGHARGMCSMPWWSGSRKRQPRSSRQKKKKNTMTLFLLSSYRPTRAKR